MKTNSTQSKEICPTCYCRNVYCRQCKGYHCGCSWNSKTRFKGVVKLKNSSKWNATITINKKTRSLGNFATEEEAAAAYAKAAKRLFGDFAYIGDSRDQCGSK